MKVGEETTEVSSMSLATMEPLVVMVDAWDQVVEVVTVESLAVRVRKLEIEITLNIGKTSINIRFTW